MHNEDLPNVYCTSSIIIMINSMMRNIGFSWETQKERDH
jgi:hypothetical protein